MQETRPSSIKPSGSNRAMKLGSKAKDVDSFVDQLKSEGERVVSATETVTPASTINTPAVDVEVWVVLNFNRWPLLTLPSFCSQQQLHLSYS